MVKLNQSEHLIGHLIEVLHEEVGDLEANLSVDKTVEDNSVTLTIENEDSIVSINTASLITELRASLDQLWKQLFKGQSLLFNPSSVIIALLLPTIILVTLPGGVIDAFILVSFISSQHYCLSSCLKMMNH